MIEFLKENFINILVVTILLLSLLLMNIYIYKPVNKKLVKRVTLIDKNYEGYCNKNHNKDKNYLNI